MEVKAIKEGELVVYSGQRQFPLTFQMPESGLALAERRWHAPKPGGRVHLKSISATSLDVFTCGAACIASLWIKILSWSDMREMCNQT